MTLEAKMTRHKQRYFGHIKRTNDAIGKKIMPGKMEGNRGRPCTRWADGISKTTHTTSEELNKAKKRRMEETHSCYHQDSMLT